MAKVPLDRSRKNWPPTDVLEPTVGESLNRAVAAEVHRGLRDLEAVVDADARRFAQYRPPGRWGRTGCRCG